MGYTQGYKAPEAKKYTKNKGDKMAFEKEKIEEVKAKGEGVVKLKDIRDAYQTALYGQSSEVVTVHLYSDEVAVEGWSFSLCHTAASANVLELQNSLELEQLNGGEPPEFIVNEVSLAAPFEVVTQSVILGIPSYPLALGPFPDGLRLLAIRYEVLEEDNLKFCDQVGDISFPNKVTVEGIGYEPAIREGAALVLGSLGTRFVRGDA